MSALATDDEDFVLLSFAIPTSDDLPRADELTLAESNVLQELLEGRTNKEIAAKRSSSVRTVANQVATIFRKLGVSSRSELLTSSALMQARGRLLR